MTQPKPKPIIFYVDDEPNNLTVFESSLPEEWEVKVFDNPLAALEALEKVRPAVIVTDQRMPQISGVRFLELARKINDDAVRIVCTGYSDENLIIQSVRSAQIFDYITKPWDPDDLESSLRRAVEFYQVKMERMSLLTELAEKNRSLEAKQKEVVASMEREASLRKELECWVPPFILVALRDNNISFPIKKDIVGITFDIVNSSKIHGLEIEGKSVRALILQIFSELILKHGGWRESHSGDSAYGHFGLFASDVNPFESALAVAQEFRVALRSLSQKYNVAVECGIALHPCRKALMEVHTVLINTLHGTFTQKSFDTTSLDIDILHKMEKMVHDLPGTNIVMSDDFLKNVKSADLNVQEIGMVTFSGHANQMRLVVIPSSFVKTDDLDKLKQGVAA
jgi:CheY-like chemotaxis protein